MAFLRLPWPCVGILMHLPSVRHRPVLHTETRHIRSIGGRERAIRSGSVPDPTPTAPSFQKGTPSQLEITDPSLT